MVFVVREITSRELTANEFRAHLLVEPTASPKFAIGDLVRFPDTDGSQTELGVISGISWVSDRPGYDDGYHYEVVFPDRRDSAAPGALSGADWQESVIELVDRWTE